VADKYSTNKDFFFDLIEGFKDFKYFVSAGRSSNESLLLFIFNAIVFIGGG
jgi:hypothetical protein